MQAHWSDCPDALGLQSDVGCQRCPNREGDQGEGSCYVAALEIPPVESPRTAVQAAIVADTKSV